MTRHWFALLLVLAVTVGVLASRGVLTAQGPPVEFEYFYDANQRLVRVIDSLSNVLTYNYDPAGNLTSVVATTTASLGPPEITSLLPAVANLEETVPVTVTGTNFEELLWLHH